MKKLPTPKPNYFIIPLITVLVAVCGSFFSYSGMPWYDTELLKPAITPPKWAFPIAWNLIFLLTTISALIIWNKPGFFERRRAEYVLLVGLFASNAFLNVLWSAIFFGAHMLGLAVFEIAVLWATILGMTIYSWKISKTASLLLLPYLIWVSFASVLTWQIWMIN